jgi:hypothetical protein
MAQSASVFKSYIFLFGSIRYYKAPVFAFAAMTCFGSTGRT